MAIWLDAGILILGLIFVLVGFHRGIIKSLVELVGTVAAVVAAILLSSMIAPVIFDSFIRPPMVEQIQGAIDNTVGQDIAAQVQQILDTLPQFLSQSLSGYGMNAVSYTHLMGRENPRWRNILTLCCSRWGAAYWWMGWTRWTKRPNMRFAGG